MKYGDPQWEAWRRRVMKRAAAGEKARKRRERDQLVAGYVVLAVGAIAWVVVTYFIRF